MRGEVGTEGHPFGWSGAFGVRLNPHIAFDGLGSGSYAAAQQWTGNTHLHTLLFGPRISFPIRMVTPFIHGGFGYAHLYRGPALNAQSGFAKLGGVGFDVTLRRGFVYRLIQADYVKTPFRSGDNAVFSTGLVYRFGQR